MVIEVKSARTDGVVDDAFWVRRKVCEAENDADGGKPFAPHRVIDRYDGFPSTSIIVAYDDAQPVATVRVVKDHGLGLPVDEFHDYATYREQAAAELRQSAATGGRPCEPLFASVGMLAVRAAWRRKGSVLRAISTMAATLCRRDGVTHILVAAHEETADACERMGFRRLGVRPWTSQPWTSQPWTSQPWASQPWAAQTTRAGQLPTEQTGDRLVPMACTMDEFFTATHGSTRSTPLAGFEDSFERMIVPAGQELFRQGDAGRHAFVITSGTIRIVRRADAGSEITLAHLGAGALFGELALIDEESRSATAIASTEAELITLERDAFWSRLEEDPTPLRGVLELLAGRIRTMDDMVTVRAFAPAQQRLEFALEVARVQTVPDRDSTQHVVFHGGPATIAASAAVDLEQARSFLDDCAQKGLLEYTARTIRFVREPANSARSALYARVYRSDFATKSRARAGLSSVRLDAVGAQRDSETL